jgi:hypothetical protein
MRRLSFCALAVLLGFLVPASAPGQGLGDAAAREREKRKQEAKPEPAKVFTDADLAKAKAPQDAETTGEALDGEASEPHEAKPAGKDGADAPLDPLERERQERKLQEAEWRVRFANAREQVALAEAACWQEVVRTEFYQGVPVPMKVKEFVETEEYRRAKQALADLEERFRRTGLPPGWARE